MNAESFEAIDEEELQAKAEQLEQFLPHSELISMSAAFELAKAIASDLGVAGCKTERLLTRELRKESLVATRRKSSKSKASQLVVFIQNNVLSLIRVETVPLPINSN